MPLQLSFLNPRREGDEIEAKCPEYRSNRLKHVIRGSNIGETMAHRERKTKEKERG